MKRVIPFSHELLADVVCPGDTVVDATMGNGHDTLFLSKLVGDSGTVYSFDIQKEALIETEKRLLAHHQKKHKLILASHADLLKYLSPSDYGQVSAAIFNLGYLPGGDKAIITVKESTLLALYVLLKELKVGGIIVLVVYHGHPGGDCERDSLLDYLTTLKQRDFDVLRYGFINQKNNPPFILAIKKKRQCDTTTIPAPKTSQSR